MEAMARMGSALWKTRTEASVAGAEWVRGVGTRVEDAGSWRGWNKETGT